MTESPTPSPASTGEIRVLHVDDEPEFAKMVSAFLEREDDRFEVETATRASEGRDLLAEGAFDCVVSDYDMPGQNGLEFLETVRESHPDLPFILYTGKGSEEVASDAVTAGVTDYLQKGSGTSQYTVLANRIGNAVEQYRAKRRVEDSQQRLSLFFEQSPLGVVEWNDAFEFVRVNAAAEELLGYAEEELVGNSWEFIVPESDREQVASVVDELLDAEGGYHSVNENVRKDGERIVCEWHNRIVTDGDGDVVSIFSQFQDVTERRERERELERYEAYLQESTDIISVLDADGTLRYVSPSVRRILGHDPEDLIGDDGFDHVHPEDVARARSAFEDLVAEPGATRTVEFRFRTADGEWRWLEVRGTNHLGDGLIDGIVANNRDITERKEREAERERTSALLSTLFEALPVGVLAEDASRTVLSANERLLDLFDMPGDPEAVVGSDCAELAESINGMFVDSEGFVERIEELVADPEPTDGHVLKLEDGRTFERSHRHVELPDGEGHLWVYRDVTERTNRERRLETMSRRLEAILENTTTPMFMKDDDGRYVFVNRGYRELFGIDEGTVVGRTDREIHPPDTAETVRANDRMVIEGAEPMEFEERLVVDGEERVFRTTKVPIYDTGERTDPDSPVAVFGVATDITDHREHERQLEALNATIRELLSAETRTEVAELGVEAARDILGLRASAIHLYDEEVDGLVPVALTDAVVELVGEPPTFGPGEGIAWKAYERGEEIVHDDVRTDPGVHNPETQIRSELHFPLGDHGVLLAGSTDVGAFDAETETLAGILATNIAAALDQVGRAQRLRARQRELQRQNERLEEFASVVSHDLRNPLNVASGRLELAREACDSEHLEGVARAHDRMAALIDDLLTLAREGQEVGDLEPVELTDLAERCWSNISTAEATIRTAVDRTLRADSGRLAQLLENLMANAVEHGGPNVTVTVGGLPEGFYVEDDGPGIPEEKREEVFAAGYSTGPEGTGFGLSIVRQVAEAHGWAVRATEGTDGGARIEVTGVEFVD